MQFITDRGKILSMEKRHGNINSRFDNVKIDKSGCERGLGVMAGRYTKPRQQCISVRNKVMRTLGFTSRSVSNRSGNVLLQLYPASVRLHLHYRDHCGSPSDIMDMVSLETIQRRTILIPNVRN